MIAEADKVGVPAGTLDGMTDHHNDRHRQGRSHPAPSLCGISPPPVRRLALRPTLNGLWSRPGARQPEQVRDVLVAHSVWSAPPGQRGPTAAPAAQTAPTSAATRDRWAGSFQRDETRRHDMNAVNATKTPTTTANHGRRLAVTATAMPVVALVSMIRMT